MSDVDNGEMYEDVEVEVTDDEGEQPATNVPIQQPKATPSPKPTAPRTPGRVAPSAAVAELVHTPPEARAAAGVDTLTPAKNPFTTRGNWSPSTFSQIGVVFPTLTPKDETTNELTRATRPECRYWKAPIKFSYSTFTSSTIRFNNVHVPYHNGNGYGSSYVYIALPGFVASQFAEAGKTRRPTVVNEKSLVPDEQRWWRIANNVEGKFGAINRETSLFHAKPLQTIFETTGRGVTVNVVVQFMAKANTEDKSNLKPTTSFTLAMEVVRAYIVDVGVDVQMPVRVSKAKPKVEPLAVARDVATDSLMKRLSELGL